MTVPNNVTQYQMRKKLVDKSVAAERGANA